MRTSKRDRFSWAREDRIPDLSYFRLLRLNWRPVTRVVFVQECEDRRRAARKAMSNRYPAKPAWSPWQWVDR